MSTGIHGHHFGNHVTGLFSGAVEKSGVAFLRHGRRDIGVFSALREQNPGTGIGVLNHHIGNKASGADTDLGKSG